MPKAKADIPAAITDIADLIKSLERAFAKDFSAITKNTYRADKISPSAEHNDFEIYIDQVHKRGDLEHRKTGMKEAGAFLQGAARDRIISGQYLYNARTEKEGPYYQEVGWMAEEYYYSLSIDTLTCEVRPGDLKGLQKIIPPKIHELKKIQLAKDFLAAVNVDKINEVMGNKPDLLARGLSDLSAEAQAAISIGRGDITNKPLRDYINGVFAKVDKDNILGADERTPLYKEIMNRFVENRKLQPVINELALAKA